MKSLVFIVTMILLCSCVTKKVIDPTTGKERTVYRQDNPIEEAVEAAIKYTTHVDIDLSPSTPEKHTIMGVDTSNWFDKDTKEQHSDVKVTEKTKE